MVDESMMGVIYRAGPLTVADYDEAIADLTNARDQIASMDRNEAQRGCDVCCDSGHTAEHCHHNPLIVARRRIDDEHAWRCYHCGFVARTSEAAQQHFGKSERDLAACQRVIEPVE